MNRLPFFALVSILVLTICPFVSSAQAAILYETGTLGPTGITWEEVTSNQIGVNVSSAVFGGVRFQLNSPVATSQVGGHFVARPDAGQSFFGAIVQLDGNGDFPNSNDLSTPDVLGATLLTFPPTSAEVFGDLNLSLQPGWYALLFGSGLFNATGVGASLLNNTDVGTPDYIGFQFGFGWGERASQNGKRFLFEGVIVPEPRVPAQVIAAAIFILGMRDI